MLLDLEKRKTLTLVLARRFPRIEDLAGFLLDELNKNLDEIAGTGTLVQLRRAVILDAEAAEWTVALIEALHRVVGPETRALLDSIGTVEEVQEARFFDDCYVDRNPLVNRQVLRAKLRAATTPRGKRILLVKGDRKSGKSHALIHVRHLARTLEVPLAEIALRNYATGEEIQPKDFGPPIASALNVELPEWLDEKPARWSLNFLDWLNGLLAGRRPLWVAFDDFEPDKLRVALPPAVEEFLRMLAERVANALTSTRLFLINYDRELPNVVKPHVDVETIPPISDTDLVDFFVLFYRDHMPPTADETVVADAVARAARVNAKVPGDPASRLERMRDALIDECQEMAP